MEKFINVTSLLLLLVFIALDDLGSYPLSLCSFNNNLQVHCLTSITSLPFNFNLLAHLNSIWPLSIQTMRSAPKWQKTSGRLNLRISYPIKIWPSSEKMSIRCLIRYMGSSPSVNNRNITDMMLRKTKLEVVILASKPLYQFYKWCNI